MAQKYQNGPSLGWSHRVYFSLVNELFIIKKHHQNPNHRFHENIWSHPLSVSFLLMCTYIKVTYLHCKSKNCWFISQIGSVRSQFWNLAFNLINPPLTGTNWLISIKTVSIPRFPICSHSPVRSKNISYFVGIKSRIKKGLFEVNYVRIIYLILPIRHFTSSAPPPIIYNTNILQWCNLKLYIQNRDIT